MARAIDNELRVRLPPDLWARVHRYAADTRRSLTVASELLLELAFEQLDEDNDWARKAA